MLSLLLKLDTLRLHGSESAIWKPPELSWLKANVDGCIQVQVRSGEARLRACLVLPLKFSVTPLKFSDPML
jgi:hypothetical protein